MASSESPRRLASWRCRIQRWVSKIERSSSRRRYVSVLDRVILAPRIGVWVLGFGNELLLVGVSEGKVELLGCRSATEAGAAGEYSKE